MKVTNCGEVPLVWSGMKTPEELVQELELAAEGSLCLYLFVGFEDTSIILSLYQDTEVLPDGRVVSERDPNFRSLLKEAIDHGGVPIGWYRLKTKEAACDLVELGPLQDRQKEPWVHEAFLQPRTQEKLQERDQIPSGVPRWQCSGHHRSEEHTSELQSLRHLVCRLLL